MLWLEEAHGQQCHIAWDDFLMPVKFHNGSSAVWIRFPDNTFHLGPSELTVLANEVVGVEKPAALTTLLVAAGSLQHHRP